MVRTLPDEFKCDDGERVKEKLPRSMGIRMLQQWRDVIVHAQELGCCNSSETSYIGIAGIEMLQRQVVVYQEHRNVATAG